MCAFAKHALVLALFYPFIITGRGSANKRGKQNEWAGYNFRRDWRNFVMARIYQYIGPAELAQYGQQPPRRTHVRRAEDVLRWISETEQPIDAQSSVVATFIINPAGALWIADRHSEHVQCAQGEDVLSAGEMTFTVDKRRVAVTAVTNQSTGYCPEPESWPAVAAALERAGLPHPYAFTTEFIFRSCSACGMTNIVKDGWFVCGVCDGGLPAQWNFDV